MINISFKNRTLTIKLGYFFFQIFMSLDIETHIFQIYQNVIFLEEFYHDRKN